MSEDITDTQESSSKLATCSFDNCTEEQVTKCRKCDRLFCVMHSNKFSPNFCQSCFTNLAAIEEKFNRVFEDYDTKTDTVQIRKETHSKYYMDGMDWPFLGLWINKLSDDELRSWWIFHFSVMKLIEAENETRKVRKNQKLREQGIGLITGVKTKTTTTVTRTTTKMSDTPEQVRAKLKKQGVPDNIIDMMIAQMKGA